MKKYKIKVLVCLLSLSFLNIHAQQGFMKSYVFGNFHGGGVIYNDDAYMIIGGTGFGNCPDNSATCMAVLQTDLDGNLNWQQRFNYPNEQFFPELNSTDKMILFCQTGYLLNKKCVTKISRII